MEKPLAGSAVYLNPVLPRIWASILRLLQKNCIFAPGRSLRSCSATATAGYMCPPVPPPAKIKVLLFIVRSNLFTAQFQISNLGFLIPCPLYAIIIGFFAEFDAAGVLHLAQHSGYGFRQFFIAHILCLLG